MGTFELTVWSMALGAIGTMAAARGVDLALRPGRGQLRAFSYHLTVFVLVLVESGVLAHVSAAEPRLLLGLQVLAGPLCVGLSNHWIRGWLGARQRDRVMARMLGLSALVLPLAGIASLALPAARQLPTAAAISLGGGCLTFWLTLRAWSMGDRLASVMAAGCLLTLPAIAGLYAIALELPLGPLAHALLAFCAAASNGCTGWVLWWRDLAAWRARQQGLSLQLDPVTRVHSGMAIVQQLVRAQKHRRRTGRQGALLAVLLFDTERVTTQVGARGLQELLVALAARLQRQVGVVNPVGRYWDRCFLALVETIDSPDWLRTLGLRVASSLRQPVWVHGHGGDPVQVSADIGVGVVLLGARAEEVEDLLDEVQRLAEAARQMRSRAATREPASGLVLPVEEAQLRRPASGLRARVWLARAPPG